MLCFVVDTRVWNATDPVTYNLWRAGDGSGMCAVCPCRGGGGVSVMGAVGGQGIQ